jgi:polysaccharide deacetylase family protein (PEP-CTERM system associated)
MICLTFDVEERFHSHLTPEDAPRQWDAGDRIAQIIDHLEAHGHQATFFMVSELAEQYPALTRRIVASGFEVASHTHTHLRIDGDDREKVKADVARSKSVLEDLTGQAVHGFRSPSWSARRSDDWFWDHLVELGFRYDSSLFPFKTHRYGSMRNPVTPFLLRPNLVELPPSVAKLGPLRLPYGGGFYFRLYPRWLTRKLIDRDIGPERAPIVYFHPWEFSPEETRMETGILNSFIANFNNQDTWGSFVELLARYRTTSLNAVAQTYRDSARG